MFDANTITIRPGLAADAPRLAALRYSFRSEYAPPTEPQQEFLRRATPWFAQRLAQPQPRWRSWLAVDTWGDIEAQPTPYSFVASSCG